MKFCRLKDYNIGNIFIVVLFFSLISLIYGYLLSSPAYADIFNIYNDAGIPVYYDNASNPQTSQLWFWNGSGGSLETIYDEEAPERVAYLKTVSQNWAGWGVFFDNGAVYGWNLSEYSGGYIKFFVKTPVNLKVEIKQSNGAFYTKLISNYGWSGQNVWQEITIPINDFGANLTQIYSPFMITTAPLVPPGTFYVDYVRWEKPNSGYTPTQVEVDGRQLLVNNDAFTVKGVSAEFTPVGQYGSAYDWSLFPEAYSSDILLIKDMGANAIRTYGKEPTQKETLDSLYQQGIYVIMGFPVDAKYGNQNQYVVDFGNPVVKENIKNCFLDMVEHWKSHPAILGWCFGNEVNRLLELEGQDPADWYSLVDECAQAAHQLEGVNYHPVTTSNSDQVVWDIQQYDPLLPNLDFWSLNLYRGLTFTDTFTNFADLSNKPLLISEFGCDAWNGLTNQEDEIMQADYLESQWSEINDNLSSINSSNVCIGGVVFSWRDGWWKSSISGGQPSIHNTQTDWTNPNYEDPNMNEEWWGVVGISTNPQERIIRQGYNTLSNLWNTESITVLDAGTYEPIQSAFVFVYRYYGPWGMNFLVPVALGLTNGDGVFNFNISTPSYISDPTCHYMVIKPYYETAYGEISPNQDLIVYLNSLPPHPQQYLSGGGEATFNPLPIQIPQGGRKD